MAGAIFRGHDGHDELLGAFRVPFDLRRSWTHGLRSRGANQDLRVYTKAVFFSAGRLKRDADTQRLAAFSDGVCNSTGGKLGGASERT